MTERVTVEQAAWKVADMLASEICGCAHASQHRSDVEKLLSFRTAAYNQAIEDAAAKFDQWAAVDQLIASVRGIILALKHQETP